ncbi:MAG: UDP-N-acetylglucosamine 2-epimerase (non-hydrolyzing) [Ignavibacteriales bacterium]|nr:UDP-N-acetylglucosamine 2-epimerase (non-hydrolyzing) [Ignavibacteriales bacterium]
MKKILIVAGTRPEIIKLAPVIIQAKEKFQRHFEVSVCLTGQHQTMADEALEIFRIKPDSNLNIMRPNQQLNDIAGAVFDRLPKIMSDDKPDVLLVQGDTTTAAMAALAGFNMKIPVGHVEAGLRSFNLEAPYPEECNRRVINTFAEYNFCPTDAARQNLKNEAVPEKRIFVTGNTIVDAVNIISKRYDLNNLALIDPKIRAPYVLITAHRRESFGQGFEDICEAIRASAIKFPDLQFVYPVHLNPNVQKPVHELLRDRPNVLLLKPVPYLQLLTLLRNCTFVLTDSGGIQEEAPSFGKYCIVLREVTERMESVHLGISELVGTNVEKIASAIEKQIQTPMNVVHHQNPYGDGSAAEKILSILQ